MKRAICASALLLAAGTARALDVASFDNPPKDHRPETWFHLIGGNVAKGGLAADLDAVAAAGISGIQLFHGQFGGPWPGVSPPSVVSVKLSPTPSDIVSAILFVTTASPGPGALSSPASSCRLISPSSAPRRAAIMRVLFSCPDAVIVTLSCRVSA